MIGRLRKLFQRSKPKPTNYVESVLDDLPAQTTTSQQAIDTERGCWFLPSERIVLPPYDLASFLTLYEGDPLSKALIDSDTSLTISPLEAVSESDKVNDYVQEFHRRIDLASSLWEACRDVALYGFSVLEIVGDGASLLDSSKILGLRRVDPRFLILQKDKRGRVVAYRQRPGFGAQSYNLGTVPLSFDNPLDPQSVLYFHAPSPRTIYGMPLLKSVQDRIEQRNHLIDAATLAARNHANPVHFLNWFTDLPVDDKELGRVLRRIKAATRNIDENNSRWLHTAGGQGGSYQYHPIGHNSVPDLTSLIDSLTQEIVCSCGHSVASLDLSLSTKASSKVETNNKSVISNIQTKQRRITDVLTKLYKLLPLIESACPSGEILVRMEEPDLTSQHEKQETATIALNNAILKARAGIISGEMAAKELGHSGLHDAKLWATFLASNASALAPTAAPNDPNIQQQQRTKILGKGKEPGNNPSGGKQ